jgi:hypothetical protein
MYLFLLLYGVIGVLVCDCVYHIHANAHKALFYGSMWPITITIFFIKHVRKQ